MGYTLISRSHFDNVATSTVDFTLNSDYDEILFVLSGFRPSANLALGFQFITASEAGYDRPIQSTAVNAHMYCHDYSHSDMSYQHSYDRQHTEAASSSTQFALFGPSVHTGKSHSNASGEMTLYKPHDTSFYKYFLTDSHGYQSHIHDWQQYNRVAHTAGYVKDTSALTGIRFVSSTYLGDQDGTINYLALSMYGLE